VLAAVGSLYKRGEDVAKFEPRPLHNLARADEAVSPAVAAAPIGAGTATGPSYAAFRDALAFMAQGYGARSLLDAACAHALRCWVCVAKRRVPAIIASWEERIASDPARRVSHDERKSEGTGSGARGVSCEVRA
jgi:hypothetical protein